MREQKRERRNITNITNMKTNNKRWIAILIVAFVGMVEVANAFYDPGLQRWLSRDPIGEVGGYNLYGFVRNVPTVNLDAFGLYRVEGNKIFVDECEIVILYGDQQPKVPYEFVFPKGKQCAGGAVVCWPDKTNKRIPKENQIPDAPVHGEQVVWPAKNPTDRSKQEIAEHPEWGNGPDELKKITTGAEKKARSMVGCDEVKITFFKTPGGALKTGIPDKPDDIVIIPPAPLPPRPARPR